jgi:ankyrin repeat protein
MRTRHFRALALAIASGFAISRLLAQNVALGSFAHEDYERNDAGIGALIADQLIARLGSETPCAFVDRVDIDRVIREQSLVGGEATAENVAQIGKLLQVDLLLSGTFRTPDGGRPEILLEVVETSRAETVARARVELSAFLQRGNLAPLSDANLTAIARSAAPLLADGWREVKSRPGQILIKPLSMLNLTGDADWDQLGSTLEDALAGQTPAGRPYRVLRTQRAELATQESELRLLGLASADAKAWTHLADHYLWAVCQKAADGPTLILTTWDGRTTPRIHTYPLPASPSDSAAFAARIAPELLAATATPTREIGAGPNEKERDVISALLAQQAASIADPVLARARSLPGDAAVFESAKRLLAASIFLSPADPKTWLYMEKIRTREATLHAGIRGLLRRAAALEYSFSLPPRFILGPDRMIRPGISFAVQPDGRSPFEALSDNIVNQGENYSDIHQGNNLLRLRARLRTALQTQLDACSRQLAASAAGQEKDFRAQAEAILTTAFALGAPQDYEVRLVDRLWPRLKVALFAHRAWNPEGPLSRTIDDRIRALYLQQGRLDDARMVDLLTASESEQALAVPPPPGSAAAGAVAAAATWQRIVANQSSSAPTMAPTAEARQFAAATAARNAEMAKTTQRNAAAMVSRGQLWLKSQCVTPPDQDSLIPTLLDGPLCAPVELLVPLEAYPVTARMFFAMQLRPGKKSPADTMEYPPAVLDRLRAKIDAWVAGEPAYVPPSRPLPVKEAPRYLSISACASLLSEAAQDGDLSSLARLFELGAPVEASGDAFLKAVRYRQWAAVEYLLKRGYDPAAPWPPSVREDNEALGALALQESLRIGKTDLADRLLASGIRFNPKLRPITATIEQLVLRNDIARLRKLLVGQPLPPANDYKQNGNYLAATVYRRNIDMLNLLLAAGAAPQRWVGKSDFILLDGGLLLTESWRTEPDFDSSRENSLTLAARLNWREGVAAMLGAPAFDPEGVLEHWPHRLASDPGTRALLLRATLEYNRSTDAAGTDLLVAIAANDIPSVTAAWANPVARHARARFGQSPLAFAITENHPAIARLLVERGARLDDFDEAGVTPLAHAAALGDVELVRFLASKGADLNLRRDAGNSPLGYAIFSRQESTALALLELGASIEAPADRPAADPLFQATIRDLPAVVDRLLACGANPRAIRDGMSIFFPAARSNNPELIQRFIDLGCDLSQRSAQGWSPLVSAVRWGAPESTAKLLKLGLRDPLATDVAVSLHQDRKSQYRPRPDELKAVHYRPDYRRCLELVREQDDLKVSSPAYARIFWHDLKNKTQAEVSEYLKQGGDVNYRSSGTPLQMMVRWSTDLSETGRADVPAEAWIKFLLEHGADPEICGETEPNSALGLAIGHPGILRLLLSHKARVDGPIHYGRYDRYADGSMGGAAPLAVAIYYSQFPVESARVLLDFGAPITPEVRDLYQKLAKNDPSRTARLKAVLKPEELRQLEAPL